MRTPTFTEIDSSSIATACLTYGKAQSIPIGRDSDHADVIGRKRVSPYGNAALSEPPGHPSDGCTIALADEKGLSATVAPLGYMMRIMGDNHSCDSRHGRDSGWSRHRKSRIKYHVPRICQAFLLVSLDTVFHAFLVLS